MKRCRWRSRNACTSKNIRFPFFRLTVVHDLVLKRKDGTLRLFRGFRPLTNSYLAGIRESDSFGDDESEVDQLRLTLKTLSDTFEAADRILSELAYVDSSSERNFETSEYSFYKTVNIVVVGYSFIKTDAEGLPPKNKITQLSLPNLF